MSNYLSESIKNNYRQNIKYIYPVASDDKLCQLISAFANSSGGYIVLGVLDDGKNIKVKSFEFQLKEHNIRRKLSDNASINFGKMIYDKSQLTYIQIQKSDTLVTFEGTAYTLDANMKVRKITIKKLFLSYCHSDKCISDIIDTKLNELAKERIFITRDVRTMGYKDDIEKFMQTIEQHDFTITIISDKYLKSRGCMYEISELMRSREYFDKLLFIVLSANDIKYYDSTVKESDVKADIYSINRFDYIKYWESEKEKIDRLDIEITDIALKQGIVDEAKQVAIISRNIAEFIEKLKNSMGKSFDEMLADDFKDFLSIVLC